MSRENQAVVLGVTGGVASGKSTLVRFLVERGAASVSADMIARDLLSPGSDMTLQVLAHFGPNFALDTNPAQIERSELARRIFADDRARHELGEMMHPTIHLLTQKQIEHARADPQCRLVAVEIPLLYENRLDSSVDKVLVAKCSEGEQLRRLMARGHYAGEAEALRQIRSQIPVATKAHLGDFTIDTSQSLEVVQRQAGDLYDELTARSGGGANA